MLLGEIVLIFSIKVKKYVEKKGAMNVLQWRLVHWTANWENASQSVKNMRRACPFKNHSDLRITLNWIVQLLSPKRLKK